VENNIFWLLLFVVDSLALGVKETLEKLLEKLLEMAVQDCLFGLKRLTSIPWSNWSGIWKAL
jgi:hypothetical protein